MFDSNVLHQPFQVKSRRKFVSRKKGVVEQLREVRGAWCGSNCAQAPAAPDLQLVEPAQPDRQDQGSGVEVTLALTSSPAFPPSPLSPQSPLYSLSTSPHLFSPPLSSGSSCRSMLKRRWRRRRKRSQRGCPSTCPSASRRRGGATTSPSSCVRRQ